MNKTPIFTLLFTILLASMAVPALAATLTRDMPSRVDPGSTFTSKLIVADAKPGEALTIEETLPKGVSLQKWDVTGAREDSKGLGMDPKKFRVKDNAYGWSLTPTGPVTIIYTATAPSTTGSLNFDAVYFDQGGFNHNTFTLSVGAAPAPVAEPAPAPAPSPAPTSKPAPKSIPPAPTPQPGGSNALVWIVGLIILIAAVWYFYVSSKK